MMILGKVECGNASFLWFSDLLSLQYRGKLFVSLVDVTDEIMNMLCNTMFGICYFSIVVSYINI